MSCERRFLNKMQKALLIKVKTDYVTTLELEVYAH